MDNQDNTKKMIPMTDCLSLGIPSPMAEIPDSTDYTIIKKEADSGHVRYGTFTNPMEAVSIAKALNQTDNRRPFEVYENWGTTDSRRIYRVIVGQRAK